MRYLIDQMEKIEGIKVISQPECDYSCHVTFSSCNSVPTSKLAARLKQNGIIVDYRDRYDVIRMSVLSLVTDV